MKKAAKGGKAVKLSHEVIAMLEGRAKEENESYDSVIRTLLKLPSRKGKQPKLKTFYVLSKPEPAIFSNLALARGESMVRSAMRGKRKAEKPTKIKVKA